ncbi:MAG: hypothetical protein J2P36_00105 [Ktedonobacteraceae bacterium]|nr:hypothetical protein [Ktedonobacteraceae bacterium]
MNSVKGGKIFAFSPTEVLILNEVVLDPDPTEDLDGRNLAKPDGRQRIEHGSQQLSTVFSNLFGQGETTLL